MCTVDAEKAGRDGRSAEELLRRVQRLHEEEQRAVQAALKDVTERLDAVTKAKEQEAAKRADAQDQVKELRAGAEKLRITVSCSTCSRSFSGSFVHTFVQSISVRLTNCEAN